MDNTKYLKNFVDPKDYDKLLNILKEIHTENIKKTTSIINIYGKPSCGKTCLSHLLTNRGSFSKINITNLNYIAFKQNIIIYETEGNENYDNEIKEYIKTVKNGELKGRELYKNFEKIENPGVLILITSEPIDFTKERDYSFNDRKPVSLHLPFKQNAKHTDITTECKKEFLEILKEEERVKRRAFTLLLCLKRNKVYLYKDLKQLIYGLCLN